MQPDSHVEEGSNVTVCCRVTSHSVSPRRITVMIRFKGYDFDTQLKLMEAHVYEYRTVIASVTESSSGDYVCVIDQLLDGHCIEETRGVYLNVTSNDGKTCMYAIDFKLCFLF